MSTNNLENVIHWIIQCQPDKIFVLRFLSDGLTKSLVCFWIFATWIILFYVTVPQIWYVWHLCCIPWYQLIWSGKLSREQRLHISIKLLGDTKVHVYTLSGNSLTDPIWLEAKWYCVTEWEGCLSLIS